MIGMLRDISPESDRLQGVIDKCYYDGEFYMNPILMKDVLNCHNSIPGSIHKVSVAKIIKAGRSFEWGCRKAEKFACKVQEMVLLCVVVDDIAKSRVASNCRL